ncbi:MAG: Fic family protein [Patescibacteria group bacterium]
MIEPHHPPKLLAKYNFSTLSNELASASFELGRLDGLQRSLPNPQILISPLLIKEATISSRIEGTRSTISDVLKYEATGEIKHPDTVEVSNYKKAMVMAIEQLKNTPIDLSFIKGLHQILLENTRGHKTRGNFRKEQVWIGKEGEPIEKATYIPLEALLIQDYMENLEEYLLGDGEHPLIKVGILHYQFEAIHPFQDGNGRIGRLLIPLYLFWKKLLFQPTLYISGYFDKRRDRYIDALNQVDKTGEYERWLKFFLISVKNQAKETQNLISKINTLMKEVENLTGHLKSPYTYKIVNFMFRMPIFKVRDVSKSSKIEERTIRRLLTKFSELDVVKIVRFKNRRIYIFEKLIKLLSY